VIKEMMERNERRKSWPRKTPHHLVLEKAVAGRPNITAIITIEGDRIAVAARMMIVITESAGTVLIVTMKARTMGRLVAVVVDIKNASTRVLLTATTAARTMKVKGNNTKSRAVVETLRERNNESRETKKRPRNKRKPRNQRKSKLQKLAKCR
jgi:hypothetical protein